MRSPMHVCRLPGVQRGQMTIDLASQTTWTCEGCGAVWEFRQWWRWQVVEEGNNPGIHVDEVSGR